MSIVWNFEMNVWERQVWYFRIVYALYSDHKIRKS